jgi:hypothetical protein
MVRVWLVPAGLTVCRSAHAQTLEGSASLPADSCGAGPTSGQFIPPPLPNGPIPPLVDEQPIQGFSSVLRTSRGDFLAMPDNGFGAKENSPDYVLRVYRISPDFRTARSGRGRISVKSYITLRDPNHKINFPIVADAEFIIIRLERSIRSYARGGRHDDDDDVDDDDDGGWWDRDSDDR